MHHSTKKAIWRIINAHSGPGCVRRRIIGLERKGYTVIDAGTRLNFGSTGTIKGDLVQLGCATGIKSRRDGHHYNICPIWKISKIKTA